MYRYILIFAAMGIGLSNAKPCTAQEVLSRRNLNTLTRTAHTEEQFARLETYYKEQAAQFKSMEHLAKEQMDHALSANLSSKYPSEYERSRNLWMYYSSRKEQAITLEEHYREKKDSLKHAKDDEAAKETHAAGQQP